MRDQKGFQGYRVGAYSPKDGRRVLYDAAGEPIRDEKGEFLGGLVMFYDVTELATTIKKKEIENESQFENICNMVCSKALPRFEMFGELFCPMQRIYPSWAL